MLSLHLKSTPFEYLLEQRLVVLQLHINIDGPCKCKVQKVKLNVANVSYLKEESSAITAQRTFYYVETGVEKNVLLLPSAIFFGTCSKKWHEPPLLHFVIFSICPHNERRRHGYRRTNNPLCMFFILHCFCCRSLSSEMS